MTFKEVTEAAEKLKPDKARAVTKELPMPDGTMLEWTDSAQISKSDDDGTLEVTLKFAPPASRDFAEALAEVRFTEVQSKAPANGKYVTDMVDYVIERYGQPSQDERLYRCNIGSTGKLLKPGDREPVAETYDQRSLTYYEANDGPKKRGLSLTVDIALSCQRTVAASLSDDRITQDREASLATYIARLRQEILKGEAAAKRPRF